jgi:tetratricopeptide (TPR) repeat protein
MWKRRSFLLAILLFFCGGVVLAIPQFSAWYHFRAARSALTRSHLEEARAHLRICLRVWPNHVATHLLAARVAWRTQDLSEAKEHLLACQRLQPVPAEDVLLEWSLLRLAGGDEDSVVKDFLQSRLHEDPDLLPLIYEAAVEGHLCTYRLLPALACLNRWLQQQPGNVQALFWYGHIFLNERPPARAVPYFRQVLALDPEHDEARRRLAFCLLESNAYDEALSHWEQLHRRLPEDVEVSASLARCLVRLGRYSQAEQLLATALTQQPAHPLALQVRGQLALLAEQPAEAEDWLRQALRTAPQEYQTHWLLYQALLQQGKTKDAEAQLERTLDLDRKQRRLAVLLQHEAALRPHDPAVSCELGSLLLDLKDRENGRRWLLWALHQDPHYRPAHEALVRYDEKQGASERAADQHRQTQISNLHFEP